MSDAEAALYVGTLIGSVVTVLTRPFADALSRWIAHRWIAYRWKREP